MPCEIQGIGEQMVQLTVHAESKSNDCTFSKNNYMHGTTVDVADSRSVR